MLSPALIILASILLWGPHASAAADSDQENSKKSQIVTTFMESPRDPNALGGPVIKVQKKTDSEETDSEEEIDLNDRADDLELGLGRVSSLDQAYITMVNEHHKEFKAAIIRIHAAMRAKRAQPAQFRGHGQRDEVAIITERIEERFGNPEAEPGGMPMRAFGMRKKRRQGTAELEARKGHVSKMVHSKIASVLQDHELDGNDLAAAQDTAQIIGSFVEAQCRNGVKPNPKDLIGFLASVNFIDAAPAAAEFCGRLWGCKPTTVRRVTIVFWIVAIILTLAIQGASIASNYLTVAPSSSDSTPPPSTNSSASNHLLSFIPPDLD